MYTALNQTCGWLGETSTEITGAEDLHPSAAVTDIPGSGASLPVRYFDLHGRRLHGKPASGVYIELRGDRPRKVIIR